MSLRIRLPFLTYHEAMFGRRASLDPRLEAALIYSDRYARTKLGEAQPAILEMLAPGERLHAIAVDIENVLGVLVVTDQRLMSFVSRQLRHDVPRASITGGRIRRLSSCSYAVTLDPGFGLNVPSQDGADALLTAIVNRRPASP